MSHATLVMRDTLRELAHRKLIAALAIAVLGLTALLGQLASWQQRMFDMSMDQAEKTQAADTKTDPKTAELMEAGREHMSTMFQGFVFAIAGLGGQVIALLIFATLVAVPLRGRELRTLLARPLTRASYFGGRAAAGVVLLAAFWALMSFAFVWFFTKQGSALPATMRYVPLLLFLKCTMLGMIALTLSLYVRPLLAAILTFAVSSDWVSSQGWLYIVLPGDDRLGMARQILDGRLLELGSIALAAAYALAVSIAALCVGLLRFRRMEIP